MSAPVPGFQSSYRISHDPRSSVHVPHREARPRDFPAAKNEVFRGGATELLRKHHFQTESQRLTGRFFKCGQDKAYPGPPPSSAIKLAPSNSAMTFAPPRHAVEASHRTLVRDSTQYADFSGRRGAPLADTLFQDGLRKAENTMSRLNDLGCRTRDPSTIPRFNYQSTTQGMHQPPPKDHTSRPVTIHTFRKDPELQRQARDLSQSVARPPSAPCTPTRGTRLSHSTVQLSFPKNTALKTTYQEFHHDQAEHPLYGSSRDPLGNRPQVPKEEAKPRLDTTTGSSYRRGCTERPSNTFAKSHTFDKLKGHLRHDTAGVGGQSLHTTKRLTSSGGVSRTVDLVPSHFLSTTRKTHVR